jgi:hypothetical protein
MNAARRFFDGRRQRRAAPIAEAELEPVGRELALYIPAIRPTQLGSDGARRYQVMGLVQLGFPERAHGAGRQPIRLPETSQTRGAVSRSPWRFLHSTVERHCGREVLEVVGPGRPWRHENEGVSPMRSTSRLVGRLRRTQHCEQSPVALAGSRCILSR